MENPKDLYTLEIELRKVKYHSDAGVVELIEPHIHVDYWLFTYNRLRGNVVTLSTEEMRRQNESYVMLDIMEGSYHIHNHGILFEKFLIYGSPDPSYLRKNNGKPVVHPDFYACIAEGLIPELYRYHKTDEKAALLYAKYVNEVHIQKKKSDGQA